MSELAKGFMSFWLALAVLFAVLITLGMVIGVALGQVPHWWEPPVALVFAWGFVALGVGFLKLTHWFARNDVAWLSKTITEVLTASDKLPPPEVQATGRLHKSFLDLAGQ